MKEKIKEQKNLGKKITKEEVRKLDQIVYLAETKRMYRDKENVYIISQKSPEEYILLAKWKCN